MNIYFRFLADTLICKFKLWNISFGIFRFKFYIQISGFCSLMSIKLLTWIIRISLLVKCAKDCQMNSNHSILYYVYKRHTIFHFNNFIIIIAIEFFFIFFYPLYRNSTNAVPMCSILFSLAFPLLRTNVTLIELKLDWKYKAGVRQRNEAQKRKKKNKNQQNWTAIAIYDCNYARHLPGAPLCITIWM